MNFKQDMAAAVGHGSTSSYARDDAMHISTNASNRGGGYTSMNDDLKGTLSNKTGYEGPSYSVKYLGIVDGSMGVLSRKMALMSYNQARNVQKGVYTSVPTSGLGRVKTPATTAAGQY